MDGRKLSHKAREQLRIDAVRRVEEGESPEEVIEGLGFHRSCIYDWIAKYREGGLEALRYQTIPGRAPKLQGKQLEQLYTILVNKNPLQLKFEFALWTRSMIRELIRDKFKVKLSEVSVGRLLKKLGFTPQRPLRKAYEQDPVMVESWLQEEFPKIQKRAKKKGAKLFFADEACVRSDCHRGHTWSLKGFTPVVPASGGARYAMNIISAISPKGDMRFMAFSGKLNSDRMIEFFKRLMINQDQPIFVILDRYRPHRSKKVQQFVAAQKGKLEIFYLPPYSPELNPDELVWRDLKSNHVGRSIIKSKDQLKKIVYRALRSLQKSEHKIISFFNTVTTRYAFMSGSLCTN